MTELEAREINDERLDKLRVVIKNKFKAGEITLETYQDLAHLLWQAKKTPDLENEVVKLNHEIWQLEHGEYYRRWFDNQTKLINENKEMRDKLNYVKSLVESNRAGHAIKFDLQMMFREDAK